eukprot:gnl/Dysnectes_brevis/453_a505_4372.p1 GENE.gnl/Dysnectes_brevis/453_a505_4372~~gnl/Dysnectes_brevis/453_a505_4372.p1  ORF type:complete len:285 (-),score=94.91 gnl/Dysnectes_brevis/453_a505_4372:749-1603(-)
MAEQSTSIIVQNLPESSTEESLRSFFSFCGSIVSIQISSDPVNEDQLQAIIQFDNTISTALLMHGSKVGGNTLTVVPYTLSETDVVVAAAAPTGPPGDKYGKATTALSGVLKFGRWARRTARKVDKKAGISIKARQLGTSAKGLASQVDQKVGFTDTASRVGQSIQSGYRTVDEKVPITNIVKSVGRGVKTGAQAAGSAISSTGAWQTVSDKTGEIATQVRDVRDEAKAKAGPEELSSQEEMLEAEIADDQPLVATAVETPSAPGHEEVEDMMVLDSTRQEPVE